MSLFSRTDLLSVVVYCYLLLASTLLKELMDGNAQGAA